MNDKSIFEQDDTFNNLVKKAKRKSLKRSIMISLIVAVAILLLLWAILFVGQYVMYERMDQETNEIYEHYQIYGANVEANSASFNHFFLASQSIATATKEVNGHVLHWDTLGYFYTIIGTKAVLQNEPIHNYEVVKFHLPKIETTANDLYYLKSLPEFYSVEVGLSFKEEIPLAEVERLFPTASWLWLVEDQLYEDALSEEKVNQETQSSFITDYSEVNGNWAKGLSVEPNESFSESVANYKDYFLKTTELNGAQELLENIQQNDAKDVPVGGVILTGTLKEILPYLSRDPVRVVRKGVIIPY